MDLEDVVVLDLSQLLPGPYATQLLSEMGAEVIKIEPPGGDPARNMSLLGGGNGQLFDAMNRGKMSVELDLKNEGGLETLHNLVTNADVFFEQFRPGVAADIGFDYETVRQLNDDIIYCSLSGYGQTGPRSSQVGHDLNYLAMAGFLDMNRDGRDSEPVLPGAPIADMAGGVIATTSILGALLSRALGNQGGEYLDISMTDAALSFSQVFTLIELSGTDPERHGTTLSGEYPCYSIYETADERYVTIAAIEPRFWRNLCAALDRPDLSDHHMAESPETRAEVRRELAAEIRQYSRTELVETLDGKDVMFAPVNSVDEAVHDEQIRARDILGEDNTGNGFVSFPARTNRDHGAPTTAPKLGEHTDFVLEKYA